jgi:hypothetical protein
MGTCWLPEERLRSFPSGARCIEQYDALQLDGFGRAPLEHLLVVQALDPTLLCANCEYWRSDQAFPWRSEEASRAKGPPNLCHFCHDAGHKSQKVARGPRGHPNASKAPPALAHATQLAVEQSFSAAHEDAEAEAVLLEVLIARRTVGRQGGASAEQERDLMHRSLLLCRGDRAAALGVDEAGATRMKGNSARAIAKRAAHVCSLLVYEPDLVDACCSLVREDEERVAAGAPSAIARAAAYWRAAAARAVAAALADLAASAEAAPMQLPMQLPMLAPAHLLAQVPVAGLNDGMPVALATPYVGVPDGTPVAEATLLVASVPGLPIQRQAVPMPPPRVKHPRENKCSRLRVRAR